MVFSVNPIFGAKKKDFLGANQYDLAPLAPSTNPPTAEPAMPQPIPLPAAALLTTGLARPDYQLADQLWADRGAVFLTGTQALLRLLRMQRQCDAAAGLATQGFISGYRGSPLGGVDQQIWKAGDKFSAQGIRFLPAINEELAATAVLGTQRVEADAERKIGRASCRERV